MSILSSLPENSVRRLSKVIVRALHLVGISGVFGAAMAHSPEPVYFALAIVSGVVLVVMEAYSGWFWFVQLRGVAVFMKLLLLLPMHLYPEAAIPCLIAMIVISGFMSHAPSWIRYFSLFHGKVIHSNDETLG
jgi:membrane-bound ClpP family serine protease